jgi:septal ring factor EnvC (AmiA/AmiB activator)
VTTTARIVASIGGSLQIVGVALVFGEIWASQRALSKRTWTRAVVEGLSSPFRRLWRKVRGSKASNVTLEASVTATATLDARVTIQESEDAPIERRIEIHRRRLDAIDRQLEEIRAEAAKLRTDLGDRLNAAVGEAIEQTKRLREVVDQLGVGSVGLRALGGVLVLVGSALWVVSEWL